MKIDWLRVLNVCCRCIGASLLLVVQPVLAGTVAEDFGLVGFGTETRAGDGGRILRVTTLAAEGEGSLRAALEAKGPRIIVFEVGGVIDLGRKSLRLAEPFVTIAGQTAPSPGITLIRGGMEIVTHDVLMQHIRFRMGDAGLAQQTTWWGFRETWDVDVTTGGPQAYNIVIDHCSFAWAIDENLSVSGPRYDGPEGTSRRVTLSHNIIAEGLHRSVHSKREAHSKGTLIHDDVRDVAVVGNLYAHNDDRNPMFKAGATGVVVNNLIYDPGRIAISAGAWISEWEGRRQPAPPRIAVVGNQLQTGPSSRLRAFVVVNQSRIGDGPADVYLANNALDGPGASSLPALGVSVNPLTELPLWPAGLKALPVTEVRERVLARAGARPLDRDAVDARIVANVRAGTGRIIDSQEEVGGYPPVGPAVVRKLDVPEKGVGAWLRRLSDELTGG